MTSSGTDKMKYSANLTSLVTDLTGQLNTQEVDLLSKGPKFSLSPSVNEHTITGVNVAFFQSLQPTKYAGNKSANQILNPQILSPTPKLDTSTDPGLKTNLKVSSRRNI